jgi:hypothetical protein
VAPDVDITRSAWFPPDVHDQQRRGSVAGEPVPPATIAELCHLVRTPLNGILGSLELLIEDNLDDGARELARSAYDAAMALHLLFEDAILPARSADG